MREESEIVQPWLRAFQKLTQSGNGSQKGDEVRRAVAAFMKVDQPLVEDDADTGLAVSEWNDPDPVAQAGVVIRAEAPRRDIARGQPVTIACGDVVDVADVLPSAPDCSRGMGVIALDEAEALAEKVHPAAGVQEPAAAQDHSLLSTLDRDRMIEIAEARFDRFGRTEQLGPFGHCRSQDVLIEHVAPELKRRHGAAQVSARLTGVAVAGHPVIAEPVSEPLLRQMLAFEVLP